MYICAGLIVYHNTLKHKSNIGKKVGKMKEKSKIVIFIIIISIIILSSLPVMAGQANLAYSPKSHDFGRLRQGATNFTTFSIWNGGCYCETLTYYLDETCDWINVYPQSGSTRYGLSDKDSITVTIITMGLPLGYHQCNISINSNRGNKVFTVGVTVIANTNISPQVVFVDDDFNSSTPGWSHDHFTSIQDAINAVADNGTVYVNNGTYYENLQITKDKANILHLRGENRNTTIIKGITQDHVISVKGVQVTISGFTIQNNFQIENGTTIDDSKGIVLYDSAGSHIQGNIIQNTRSAISMDYVTDTVIEDNLITLNYEGIILYDSDNNALRNNSIEDNVDEGMLLWNLCDNNTVLGNRLVDNGNYGIYVDRSSHNIFRLNTVSESHFGIYLYYPTTQFNSVTENTFDDNYNGLFILRATNNSIYLNNFLNNTHGYNLTGSSGVQNTWCSPYPLNYTFGDYPLDTFQGYLGNYWKNYTGTDTDGNGLGDSPYIIHGDGGNDSYPLIRYWEDYFSLGNLPPSCSLIIAPLWGESPFHVTFTLNATDSDGVIVSWTLDVDNDGSPEYGGEGVLPIHQDYTYELPGNYTACLSVMDDDTAVSSATVDLLVMEPPNVPPIANFTFSPPLPSDTETVVFEDLSNDTDGTIISYLWDFGDNATSTEMNPQHRYSDNGTYSVYLIVTDDDGLTGNISRNITIINVAPEAFFNLVSPLPLKEKSPIFFLDNSSDPDGSLVNWTWNLGDGSMAFGKAITHTYTKQGTYNVTLTVMDNDHDTDVYTQEFLLEKEDKDTSIIPGFEMPLLCSIILLAVILKRKK